MAILRAPVTLSRWGWLTDQRHFTVTVSRTFHWFDKLWTKLTFDDSWMDNVEKKTFNGFYHIWAWWPSWSCNLDNLKKLLFPHCKEAPHEIWLQSDSCFRGDVWKCWQHTYLPTNGRQRLTYTISSGGSGELKSQQGINGLMPISCTLGQTK